MANSKARKEEEIDQNKEQDEVAEVEKPVMATDEQIAEAADGLDADISTTLVPILQQLPAHIVDRVTDLLAEMSPGQEGLEEMDSRWSPPNIKCRQGMSTDFPKGIELGDLYTDDGETLPSPFEFVPLYMYPSFMKFDDNNKLDCMSDDCIQSTTGTVCKECPDEPFKHGEATACSKYKNVFVYDKNFRRVYKIGFAKTSLKAGTKLEKYMRGSGKNPWKKIYILETNEKTRQGGSGIYYVYNVKPTNDRIEDDTLLALAHFFKDRIQEARVEAKRVSAERRAQADSRAKSMQMVDDGTPTTEAGIPANTKAPEPNFGDTGA